MAGQQQQPINDSAEEAILGGGGGFFISLGGATNPGSPVPSPEIKVPVHNVAASAADITFLLVGDFIFELSVLGRKSRLASQRGTGESLATD